MLLALLTSAIITASAVTQGASLAGSREDKSLGRESSLAGSKGVVTDGIGLSRKEEMRILTLASANRLVIDFLL